MEETVDWCQALHWNFGIPDSINYDELHYSQFCKVWIYFTNKSSLWDYILVQKKFSRPIPVALQLDPETKH